MRCTQREPAACGFALAQPGLREPEPASGHTPTPMTTPQFPTSRPRRLRHNPLVRAMVRETALAPDDFILPLFVRPGRGVRNEIASMPGNFQLSVDTLVEEV